MLNVNYISIFLKREKHLRMTGTQLVQTSGSRISWEVEQLSLLYGDLGFSLEHMVTRGPGLPKWH